MFLMLGGGTRIQAHPEQRQHDPKQILELLNLLENIVSQKYPKFPRYQQAQIIHV